MYPPSLVNEAILVRLYECRVLDFFYMGWPGWEMIWDLWFYMYVRNRKTLTGMMRTTCTTALDVGSFLHGLRRRGQPITDHLTVCCVSWT